MALLKREAVVLWVPQATGNSALIDDAIRYANRAAGRYCGRPDGFESASHDEYFSCRTGQRAIILHHAPVTSITLVQEWAQEGSATTLASTDYILDGDAGLLYRDGSAWTPGHEQVRVTYVGGYTEDTLEDEEGLRMALLQLVAYRIGFRGNVGNVSASTDGESATREETVNGIPRSVASALAPYCVEETT